MSNASPHRPTQRVIDILELVARDGAQAYTLTEIATELDAPKSTLFPIVHTLKRNHYLKYNELTGRYSMGPNMYELGMKYIQDNGVYDEVLGLMQHIVKECSESCHYAELSDGNALYLMKVDSPEAIRMFSAPGRKMPAYSTALGKALLSDLSKGQIRDLYPDGLQPVTKNTITDLDELFEQLLEIRETGIATEWEESADLIRCFAVPIRYRGSLVAAISVAIPTFRCTDEKTRKIQGLLAAARPKIESLLESYDNIQSPTVYER